MVFFIHHDGTTVSILSASNQGLPVNERPHRHQRLDRDARLFLNRHDATTLFVEHPARNRHSEILWPLHDHGRLFTGSQPANHLDLAAKERMKPVDDPRRAELMSSVSIPCAILLPRTC